jgi:hypothetical protein
MFGRGMRDHKANSGFLFTKATPIGAGTIATNLMKEDSVPFKDGPAVIEKMRKAATDFTSQLGKKLGNGAVYPWMMTLDDYKKLK